MNENNNFRWDLVLIVAIFSIIAIVGIVMQTIKDKQTIELPNPIITQVSGDNTTGYILWVETTDLNIDLEEGKNYTFYLYMNDVDKAIEEYEKNKSQ